MQNECLKHYQTFVFACSVMEDAGHKVWRTLNGAIRREFVGENN